MKNTFSINDVSLMTGLSTRTIRNYIGMGFLKGEKTDRAWVFTPEQLQEFLTNKAVQPSIKAKKNAIVFDFLGTKHLDQNKICVIWDLISEEGSAVCVSLCQKINDLSPEAELRFASDKFGKGLRVILSGSVKDVMTLITPHCNA